MQQAVTLTQFEEMFPKAGECYPYFAAPGSACDEFGITTTERLAAFFAQLSHESVGLTRLEESFAYTPARLMSVFPFRFKKLTAATEYVTLGPKAIASLVYANRMGNGPEKSGDGWTYRGRGFIQLTGRRNYAEFAAATGVPFDLKPNLAAHPPHAARIAARYWQTRGCNEMADILNLVGITKAINGGLTGLKDRIQTWNRFRSILGLKVEAIA